MATSPSIPETAAAEREERLALLLTALTDRVQRGEHVELEEQCLRHGEFAAELRELWGAVMIAQAAGSGSIAATIPAQTEFPSGTLTLPARFGDYELVQELGRGGMGVVYRAK